MVSTTEDKIEAARKEEQAKIKKIQEEHQAALEEAKREEQSRVDKINQDNQTVVEKLKQEIEALKKTQLKGLQTI